MNPLTVAMGSELFWEQPKVSQHFYVLRSLDESIAQLEFVSTINSNANSSAGDEHWTFKQLGFFSTRVSVHPLDSEVELASYQPNWMGTSGEIQFSMGGIFTWAVMDIMGTRFSISKLDGPELITYFSGARSRKFSNLFKQQAQMVIAPDALQTKDLSVLVLLGWYLVIIHNEDAALAASTASLGALY
jgi:hypothetical protein